MENQKARIFTKEWGYVSVKNYTYSELKLQLKTNPGFITIKSEVIEPVGGFGKFEAKDIEYFINVDNIIFVTHE